MLDPAGRKEVLDTVHELNKTLGITIILITHYMEEAARADRVIVIDQGQLKMDGTPKEIFSHLPDLREMRLAVPVITELSEALQSEGVDLPDGILTREEFLRVFPFPKGGAKK